MKILQTFTVKQFKILLVLKICPLFFALEKIFAFSWLFHASLNTQILYNPEFFLKSRKLFLSLENGELKSPLKEDSFKKISSFFCYRENLRIPMTT